MKSTRLSFTLKTEVSQSLRANQVCSMFDAPVAEKCERSFDIDFPWDAEPWNVGLVVGPSGSGKSSVLRQVWGEPPALRWDAAGLVDDFPESATTEEISSALSSVGFSTVPAWLRPHRVLSVGEQFRSDVARRLMSDADPVVVDEFTSVVDRQVAQVASHAIQRHVRANKRRFVAVGCHYDVIDWLQPDWVLDMATQTFTRRLLQRRPTVRCTIGRLPRAAWSLFSPFHYMSADLPNSCHGFGLWANGKLACSLWLAVFPHPMAKDIIRVARVVTLPDYQGLGLAFRLLETLGGALTAAGKRLRNYPAHPAFIAQHEAKSAVWRKVKDQSFGPENGKGSNEGGRYCAVFEFIGPANARFASTLGVMRGLKGDGDWADAAALTQDASSNVVPFRAPASPSTPEVGAPDFRSTLAEWIPRCDPRWGTGGVVPLLAPVLERTARGGVRAVIACSVRHYKTTTVMCACSWWLRRDPTLRIIYMSYSAARASEVGRDIRDVCKRTGVQVAKDHDTIAQWRTEEGGGVSVMSAQQSKLGADVDILIVDDPYESGDECDKPEVRSMVDATIAHYTSRLNVGGSALLVMSPWRPDDALAVRRERGWEYVFGPAITQREEPDGTFTEIPLDANVRTVDQLHAIRTELAQEDPSERLWFSQWQCQPFIPAANAFDEPASYGALPTWPGWRDGIGVDFSYSAKRAADWFAICSVRIWGSTAYVTSMQRFRADEGLGEQRLREVRATYPNAQIFSYMSGPEIGIAHNLARKGLPINVLPARFNKMIRARRTIDRWKARNIQWPESLPDRTAIVSRFKGFRGLDGDSDDEVDALVSVCDGMMASGVTSPAKTMGRPRWT